MIFVIHRLIRNRKFRILVIIVAVISMVVAIGSFFYFWVNINADDALNVYYCYVNVWSICVVLSFFLSFVIIVIPDPYSPRYRNWQGFLALLYFVLAIVLVFFGFFLSNKYDNLAGRELNKYIVTKTVKADSFQQIDGQTFIVKKRKYQVKSDNDVTTNYANHPLKNRSIKVTWKEAKNVPKAVKDLTYNPATSISGPDNNDTLKVVINK